MTIPWKPLRDGGLTCKGWLSKRPIGLEGCIHNTCFQNWKLIEVFPCNPPPPTQTKPIGRIRCPLFTCETHAKSHLSCILMTTITCGSLSLSQFIANRERKWTLYSPSCTSVLEHLELSNNSQKSLCEPRATKNKNANNLSCSCWNLSKLVELKSSLLYLFGYSAST